MSGEDAARTIDDDEGYYTNVDHEKQPPPKPRRGTPWHVWPVLLAAVLAGGLAGPIAAGMEKPGPVSLAGWRNQITSMILMPLFVYGSIQMPKTSRRRAFMPRTLGLLFLSSLGLAGHFATYTWALFNTSVPHALFLTNISPIFVAIYVKLRGGKILKPELIGVTLGIIGMGVIGAGTNAEEGTKATYLGDFMAAFSAVNTAVYLMVGKSLRNVTAQNELNSALTYTVVRFIYQGHADYQQSGWFDNAGSTASRAIILGAGGLVLEGWNTSGQGDISGLFSWTRKEFWLPVLCLGAGPGVIGHTGYSHVIKYASPLVMPTGLSLQPIVGSAVSWAIGQTEFPGIWTCLGAVLIIGGTLCVSYANAHHQTKEKEEAKDEDQEPAPVSIDEEEQQSSQPLLQPADGMSSNSRNTSN